jgi:hypothetical protein
MKNKSSMFAASSPETNLYGTVCGSYFYSCTDAALSKDIRLSIHNGLPHSCCNLSLARCGEIAFPLLNTLVFHYMPKTMKDYKGAKHSNAHVTPDSAKTVSFKEFQIEMNAKNQAYYFILSNGLLDRFKEFCDNYHSDDPHADCVRYLLSKIQSL